MNPRGAKTKADVCHLKIAPVSKSLKTLFYKTFKSHPLLITYFSQQIYYYIPAVSARATQLVAVATVCACKLTTKCYVNKHVMAN